MRYSQKIGRGIEVASPGKINLCLHVLGRQENGYHLLDSLVTFCAGDKLRVEPAEEDRVCFAGAVPAAMAKDDWRDNLAYKALQAFRRAYGGMDQHWRITITKNLPVGGGVGGGSSNAAAMLRVLGEDMGLRLNAAGMMSLAGSLGADVPACLLQRNLRMGGIGHQLDPIEMNFPEGWVLLANPGKHVATPAVFRALDLAACHGPLTLPDYGWDSVASLSDWLKAETHNDLTTPAIKLCPQIGDLLDLMAPLDGAHISRMTGSGATCFALFDEEETAQRAAQALQAAAVPYTYVSRFGDYC